MYFSKCWNKSLKKKLKEITEKKNGVEKQKKIDVLLQKKYVLIDV